MVSVNTKLVQWLSNKHSTVETSVFGAEFVAMKQGVYALRGLRNKLRIMGNLISSPSYNRINILMKKLSKLILVCCWIELNHDHHANLLRKYSTFYHGKKFCCWIQSVACMMHLMVLVTNRSQANFVFSNHLKWQPELPKIDSASKVT